MTTPDRRVQALLDHHETLQCLVRYSRGLDRRDWDLLLSAFHDDAIEKHGAFCGSPREFVEWLDRYTANSDSMLHMLGNHFVEVVGNVAHGETYFRAGNHSGAEGHLTEGRYISRFERRDREWKIAEREVVLNWSTSLVASPLEGNLAMLTSGRYDRSDISYMRPFHVTPSE